MTAHNRTVIEVDATAILHAIDRACLRMQGLRSAQPVDYAKAALEELGKIAQAKQAYDAEVLAARAAREPEPEIFNSPNATETRQ